MKTSLVIMAAGIGSRFGEGIKQLEPVGLHDEIIMDYSIHDAIAAGFNKIVFIIRKDIEEAFKERIGNRIEAVCARLGVETAYAFQDLADLPEGFTVPEGRKKPWGTGQAILAARDVIKEPFLVINADDYYGKEGFQLVHDFLVEKATATDFCMAGFIIKNTLSDNGGVTRGICSVDENLMLTDIKETRHIIKTPDGVSADGVAIDPEGYVSMNMWGLSPEFIEVLKAGFVDFLQGKTKEESDPLTGEYLLPMVIGERLKEGKATAAVLPTHEKWFGVTYKEDKPLVVESFRKLIASGVYKEELFSDL